MKEIGARAAYLLVRVIDFIFRMLPLSLARGAGRGLGDLFYSLDAKHRRITLDNLRRALGTERSEEELERIARNSYRNVGASVGEFMKLSSLSPDRVARWVRIEGIEHYLAARAEGKGVLFLTAHFGNWELMAVAFTMRGYRLFPVARPLDNPLLDRLINQKREQWGSLVLSKFGVAREVTQLLKKGETIGFLLDQNVSGKGGVFVPFFGRPASTNKGLALIALRTGAPVIPAFIVREGAGHRLVFEKEIELLRTGDVEADVLENTARFTRTIEAYVRRYPDQWLWMHRRWKTQPPSPSPAPPGSGEK
ncbi:MAG TPA: lysophospholipid acyltransferase family protein [Nitrospiria bacterium]|nr:lysophospholipid acyltransferase family protein [Nitrospiria bacterium]